MSHTGAEDDNWTLVVKSGKKGLNLQLGELWRYRDLVNMFIKRDFVSQYKQTILGPLWFILQPLLTTFMFIFVFNNVAHIGTNGIPGILFYLSGLTAWNYFATTVNKTSGIFITNAQMLGKVYFPRLTLPVSTAISGIITFGIQLLLFLSFFIYYVAAKGLEFHFTPYLLLLPLLVMLIGCLGLGTGIIISALTTKYRDLIYLVTFGVQLLMFFSPVIVPLSMVSGKKKLLLLSNPMTSVIETFRYIFFGKGEFNWTYLGCSSAAILAILIAGVLIFNKSEKNFTDTI